MFQENKTRINKCIFLHHCLWRAKHSYRPGLCVPAWFKTIDRIFMGVLLLGSLELWFVFPIGTYSQNCDKVVEEACDKIGHTLKVPIWQPLLASSMLKTRSYGWEIIIKPQGIHRRARALVQGYRGRSALNSASLEEALCTRGIWYGHQLACRNQSEINCKLVSLSFAVQGNRQTFIS